MRARSFLLTTLLACTPGTSVSSPPRDAGLKVATQDASVAGPADREDAVLETGPDDSPALRIQLFWSGADRALWTVLYAADWQRVLQGATEVRASIRDCTAWTSPRSTCSFRDGRVVFLSPVAGKEGASIRGHLYYPAQETGVEIAVPFSTIVRRGRIP